MGVQVPSPGLQTYMTGALAMESFPRPHLFPLYKPEVCDGHHLDTLGACQTAGAQYANSVSFKPVP